MLTAILSNNNNYLSCLSKWTLIRSYSSENNNVFISIFNFKPCLHTSLNFFIYDIYILVIFFVVIDTIIILHLFSFC